MINNHNVCFLRRIVDSLIIWRWSNFGSDNKKIIGLFTWQASVQSNILTLACYRAPSIGTFSEPFIVLKLRLQLFSRQNLVGCLVEQVFNVLVQTVCLVWFQIFPCALKAKSQITSLRRVMFAIDTTTTSRRVCFNPKRTEKPCALG